MRPSQRARWKGSGSRPSLARQREQALVLLHEIRQISMVDNVISFSADISACEKGRQWEQALAQLQEMRQSSMTGDITASQLDKEGE